MSDIASSALAAQPGSTVLSHISGNMRFDVELECWLNARQWRIRLNELSFKLEIHQKDRVSPLTDERLSEIQFQFVHASNGKEPSRDKLANALALIGERRSYHPVREYLKYLQWDGVQRLDTWVSTFAGAKDTNLTRAFSRKSLCAAVRRVMQPGCKFDHVLVFQGQQDLGKSSLIRALSPDESWFTDQAKVGADSKETIERTSGAWIVEFPELDGLSKRDANAVKSFITTTSDRARPAYGRYTIDRPRQFVLFGTTNERAFLNDHTGNRRWWIVGVGKCNVKGLEDIRDQLWAEAVLAEPEEKLWLDNPALKADAAAMTDASADFGPWLELLADRIPDGSIKISAIDAWRLVGIDAHDVNKISPGHRTLLRKALVGLGFDPDPKNIRRHGKQIHAYVRGNPELANWWHAGQTDW